MKKLIYSISFVLAGTVAASAAVTSASAVNSFPGMQKPIELTKGMMAPIKAERIDKDAKKVKRNAEPLTVADFVGEYKWAAYDMLQEGDAIVHSSMKIEVDLEDNEKLVITGFSQNWAPLSAYVKNDRLYIPNQFVIYEPEADTDIYFWNYSIRYKYMNMSWGWWPAKNDNTEFYFRVDEDGDLVAGSPLDMDKLEKFDYTDEELDETYCIAALIPMAMYQQGYFAGLYDMATASKVEIFQYNADEWKQVGDAKFKDAWFPNMWPSGQTPAEYDVPLYYNIANPQTYLLMNPYGPNTPYGPEFNKADYGYIMFDISDPDCVFVEPLVQSAVIDLNGEDYPIFNFNAEGFLNVVAGATTEDILIDFTQNRLSISNFDEYDADGPKVNIYNGYYSILGGDFSLLGMYGWPTDDNDPVTGEPILYVLEGYIILPSDYNAAVDTIGADDSDVEPVYYNLQGVKVANPEKGQLVIVKKGNKTSKQVIL